MGGCLVRLGVPTLASVPHKRQADFGYPYFTVSLIRGVMHTAIQKKIRTHTDHVERDHRRRNAIRGAVGEAPVPHVVHHDGQLVHPRVVVLVRGRHVRQGGEGGVEEGHCIRHAEGVLVIRAHLWCPDIFFYQLSVGQLLLFHIQFFFFANGTTDKTITQE